MSQQLGVGLAIHQEFRSKEIIKMLHGFGLSVEYNGLLRVEAQIEQSVIQRMRQNESTFLLIFYWEDTCFSPLTTLIFQTTLMMVKTLSAGQLWLFIRRPSLMTPNWKSG